MKTFQLGHSWAGLSVDWKIAKHPGRKAGRYPLERDQRARNRTDQRLAIRAEVVGFRAAGLRLPDARRLHL